MTSFSHIFRSTCDIAISQGRRPVVCLLGPDFQDEYKRFIADQWVHKPDNGVLNGIRIRPMGIPGLAMVTAPAPESGFDVA
jgi:hypothetical protein